MIDYDQHPRHDPAAVANPAAVAISRLTTYGSDIPS